MVSTPEARLDPAAPVVLVGQARSGSSLATLLLNRFAGGFVINDAYAAQTAEALGLGGPRDPARPGADVAGFAAAMLARIEARGWTGGEPPIHRSAPLTPAMRAAARTAGAAAAVPGADWTAVWGPMLRAAAEAGDRAFWGWNTPPDHTRADEILAAFPRARLVFVHRGLWPVLRSYKGLPAHWGRERARYHPLLQARSWDAARRSEARLAAARPAQVHRLDYDALLARPGPTLAALARFLGAPPFAADPALLPGNGSDPRAALSRAEVLAARLALSREGAAEAGPPPAPAPGGVWALAARSWDAGAFYAAEALRSRDMRGRMRRMWRA